MRAIFGVVVLASAAGCSLLVSTEGLSDGLTRANGMSEAGAPDAAGGAAASDPEGGAPSAARPSYVLAVGGPPTIKGAATTSVLIAPIHEDGSLGPWARAADLPEPRARHIVTGIGDSLYVFGGFGANGVTRSTSALSLRVLPDAGTTSFESLSPLAHEAFDTVANRTDQRLYAFSPSTGDVNIATIQSSRIGAWIPQHDLAGADLQWYGSSVFVGDHAFWVGPGPRAMSTTIRPDGTLEPWHAISPTPYSDTTAVPQPVRVGQRIYLVGSYGVGAAVVSNQVHVADVGADGSLGAWRVTEPFPVVRNVFRALAHNGFIYVLGGVVDATSAQESSVYFTKVRADGSLDLWTATTPLPEWRMYEYGIVTP